MTSTRISPQPHIIGVVAFARDREVANSSINFVFLLPTFKTNHRILQPELACHAETSASLDNYCKIKSLTPLGRPPFGSPPEALCVIRVPSEVEEQARGLPRQRGSLVADRTRLLNRAKGAARYYGHALPERWWRPKAFARLAAQVPEHLHQTLARWQPVLLVLDEQIDALTRLIEAARPEELPTALGALTAECIDREVGEWERFENRRQVGSYTGLIPGGGHCLIFDYFAG